VDEDDWIVPHGYLSEDEGGDGDAFNDDGAGTGEPDGRPDSKAVKRTVQG
jgi:hypothetical protein